MMAKQSQTQVNNMYCTHCVVFRLLHDSAVTVKNQFGTRKSCYYIFPPAARWIVESLPSGWAGYRNINLAFTLFHVSFASDTVINYKFKCKCFKCSSSRSSR